MNEVFILKNNDINIMYKDNKLYYRSKRFEWSVVSSHITWLKVPYIGLSDELHHSTKKRILHNVHQTCIELMIVVIRI